MAATFTGAKVVYIDLTSHVQVVYRGGYFLQGIQSYFTAIAPVVAGFGVSYVLFKKFLLSKEASLRNKIIAGYFVYQ